MVGCNEDNWRLQSKMWFVTAKQPQQFGVCFTGSRPVGENIFTPQSGMNQAGLVFSRLASYHPKKDEVSLLPKITNEAELLTQIMQTCTTVEEVKTIMNQYNREFFIDDVFIYIDSTGKYLVVEPYTTLEGTDAYYVLSNYCPSITPVNQRRNLERYKNGEAFLANHTLDTSLAFCTAVSDTMHVCRNRKGDGTLLTSIWNPQQQKVHLYFYHNFDTVATFNIPSELAKGDRMVDVTSLFPPNQEFQELARFATPFNTPSIRISLVGFALLLGVISMALLVTMGLKTVPTPAKIFALALILINAILAYYYFLLATNIGIFYFDAPYTTGSVLTNAFSYTPVLLLFASIIAVFWEIKNNHFFKKTLHKWAIRINLMVFGLSLLAFQYWGIINVFA